MGPEAVVNSATVNSQYLPGIVETNDGTIIIGFADVKELNVVDDDRLIFATFNPETLSTATEIAIDPEITDRPIGGLVSHPTEGFYLVSSDYEYDWDIEEYDMVITLYHFDAEDNLVTSINVDTDGANKDIIEWFPEVVLLANGNVAVVWEKIVDTESGESVSYTRVVVVESGTNEILSDFTTPASEDAMPSGVVALPGGGFALATRDDHGMLRIFDGVGNLLSTETLPNTLELEAVLPDGNLVAVRYRADGITVNILETDGSVVNKTFLDVQSAATGNVAVLTDGTFVLAYTVEEGASDILIRDTDLYVQRFDSNGNLLGNAVHVDEEYSENSENFPQILALSNGDFVLAWDSNDQNNPDATDIITRVFTVPILGTSGDDSFRGTPTSNAIDAGAGDDTVWAGKGDVGDDTVYGGSGDDKLGAAAGDDYVNGEDGADTLFGGDGNDTVEGESGHDTMWLGSGDDSGNAGSGNDTIGGGLGDDTMYAGSGNDTVYSGKTGDDVVYGDAGDDLLFGGTGDDSVYGGRDEDTIYGGSGNDTINGDAGDDLLFGGSGDDVLTGGGGSDTFYFASGGQDVITDFDISDDILDLSGAPAEFASVSDVVASATVQGNDILIDTGNGNSLLLEDISLSQVSDIDFVL